MKLVKSWKLNLEQNNNRESSSSAVYMGRVSICPKTGLKKGAWSNEEDRLLTDYINRYGLWNWREIPKYAGTVKQIPFLTPTL